MKPNFHFRASLWGSYSLISLGGVAMLFCFPFLWSSNIADLVGAGFPLVAGAIFVAGGIVSLSLRASSELKGAKVPIEVL